MLTSFTVGCDGGSVSYKFYLPQGVFGHDVCHSNGDCFLILYSLAIIKTRKAFACIVLKLLIDIGTCLSSL